MSTRNGGQSGGVIPRPRSMDWERDPQLQADYQNLASLYASTRSESTDDAQDEYALAQLKESCTQFNALPSPPPISNWSRTYHYFLATFSVQGENPDEFQISLCNNDLDFDMRAKLLHADPTDSEDDRQFIQTLAADLLEKTMDVFTDPSRVRLHKNCRPSAIIVEGALRLYREIARLLHTHNIQTTVIPAKHKKPLEQLRAKYSRKMVNAATLAEAEQIIQNRQPTCIRLFSCCAYCSRRDVKLAICAKCRLATYCEKSECQVLDWREVHKIECKVFRSSNEKMSD